MSVKQVAALLGGGQQKIDLGDKPGQLPALLKPKKELSTKGQKTFNSLKKKFDTNTLANMITNKTPDGSEKPVGSIDDPRLKKKQSQKEKSKVEIKPTVGKKVGKLDTAQFTSMSEDQQQRMMRGDGSADVVAKIINFMKRSRSEIVKKREMMEDFREEREAKEKRDQDLLLKQLQKKSEGASATRAGETSLEKFTPLEKVSQIGAEVKPETASRVEKTGLPPRQRNNEEKDTSVVAVMASKVTNIISEVATTVGALALGGATKVGSFLKGGTTPPTPPAPAVVGPGGAAFGKYPAPRTATKERPRTGPAVSGTVLTGAAGLSISGETGAKTKEEAVKKVGQVVHNDPKPGEASYGIFGMNTSGSIQSFVRENPQFNLKSKPASKQFDDEWKAAAAANPEAMYEAQLTWHKNHIVAPLTNDLAKVLPQEIASDPRVLVYMSDRRNQYGRHDEVNAFRFASSAKTPQDFISKITEYDSAHIDSAFATYLDTHKNQREKIRGALLRRLQIRKSYSLEIDVNTGATLDNKSKENKDMKEVSSVNMPVVVSNNNVLVNNRTQKNVSIYQNYPEPDLPLFAVYSNDAYPFVGA